MLSSNKTRNSGWKLKKKKEEKELTIAKIYPERKYPNFFFLFDSLLFFVIIRVSKIRIGIMISVCQKKRTKHVLRVLCLDKPRKSTNAQFILLWNGYFFKNKLASFCRFSFTLPLICRIHFVFAFYHFISMWIFIWFMLDEHFFFDLLYSSATIFQRASVWFNW